MGACLGKKPPQSEKPKENQTQPTEKKTTT
jgi:hypothetical protein